jgi:hypothetical protein
MMRVPGAALAILVGLLCGCREAPPPIVPAEGVVLLNGKPLAKVEVRFFPKTDYGAEYIAKGVTDEQGHFTLTCKGESGACACENHVVIDEAELPAQLKGEKAQAELNEYFAKLGGINRLPPKYRNLSDSPLVANVNKEQKSYKFELKR